ncbi:uncharacterized protein C8Q71DRAFT_758865 [Rhodofomes roseus]|uniref:Uncharacterized protein n=1 Tax=Rhodofomes roseus TaxID=34475 RepID=A0ABQ8KH16_9APHY|nr:uncharacterized protein C8Q71DRAFT_758865 [Rhodofomes roseus]KAH9836628.1 hypothetical protein C8Q71DRAFT_758865 [Rhodofomes roseus]
MPFPGTQKNEVEQIIKALLNATGPRNKRRLADMFMDLPDRTAWAEYYAIIPQPRCLSGIQSNLAKNKYKDPLDVFTDLDLVFLNALYYNEDGSQIAHDAATLKALLETEWKRRSVLPTPRASPPASSAQKTHARAAAAASKTAQQPAATKATTRPTPATRPQTAVVAPAPSAPTASVAKSPERHSSPEMDVDIGGTPEPEGPSHGESRDAEADDIVRQLEKGLPRWEGFGELGWMNEVDPNRHVEIVQAVSGYQDASGFRLAASMEAIPEEVAGLPFNFPLSLSLIESRARNKQYAFSKAFDEEMSQLFVMGRRTYEPGTEEYGHILILQRLYHALTSSNPPPGPPFTTTTNFASVRAGPGTAKPLHANAESEGILGVTTYRVSTKDREFINEVHFKGWTVRLADWLHMSNPDDPSRPIVGQVFRCFAWDAASGRKGQPGVTVAWYHRPEQTFHPARRQFWENEVFKTSHFADHPLEDIIEKIAVQFTARHIRGRPRPPYWYLGWPLYVCDSRYNDRERIFVKIKNWNSCVPEEVRKSTEFMPIYPFEKSVFPRRFSSPFLTGRVKGPGGIAEATEKGDGDKIEGGGTGRKRSKRNPGATSTPSRTEQTDRAGPSKGLYVGAPAAQAGASTSTYQYPQNAQNPRAPSTQQATDRSILTSAGLTALGSNVSTEKLPPETVKHFDRDPDTNEVLWFASPPVDRARSRPPQHSLAYLHFLAKKRKKTHDDDRAMDVDEVPNGPSHKRLRIQPTVTETLGPLLVELTAELGSPVAS